jgi:hypothetical protein
MTALNDGGCTYTLGPQPRSTVRRNYCNSDQAPVVGCVLPRQWLALFQYHAERGRDFTGRPCVYLQGCCDAPAYDINVTNLYCKATAEVQNGCAEENCVIDTATVFTFTSDQAWSDDAQAIIDATGCDASSDAIAAAEAIDE